MADELIITIAVVFLIAGAIKGTVGIGLPTASVSLLTQFFDPHTAVVLVIFPMLLSNVWQVYRSGEALRIAKMMWPFAFMLIVFVWVFSGITTSIPHHILMICLGGVVITFSLTSLFLHPPTLPPRFDRLGQLFFGTLSGMMGGLTAIWAPPLVIYLVSRRINKDDFVRITGFIVTMGSLPLCLGYWQNGLMTGTLALTSLAMFIPTLIGFSLGELIRRRVDAQRFQKVVLVVFLLMGLNIIRKAFMA
ncbi:MAG: sulfite exporter TauE/SafE family protein [Rhodospirillales bacterium]|nr:sulfite exporter TauE/SafE family protein [Rhodospirillales bacterium]